jgi:hypothetical protein
MKEYKRSIKLQQADSVILALRKREKQFIRLERLIIGLYVVIGITTAWLSL